MAGLHISRQHGTGAGGAAGAHQPVLPKSAHHAVEICRQRCWRINWVLDLDIKGFFDSIDHDLLMRAIRTHTSGRWVVLYLQRWLQAPVELPDGTLLPRDRGTPQGGVISPLLANLFLHYAFDMWMRQNHPAIAFERYADDVICHCRSQQEVEHLQKALEGRFESCGLELHPQKTQVVYCRDSNQRAAFLQSSLRFSVLPSGLAWPRMRVESSSPTSCLV